MQHKLEELCQIETVLLLETVNVSYLSQEHQVCANEKNVIDLSNFLKTVQSIYICFLNLILGCSGKVKGCSQEKFTGRWK